jgi:mannose-1-phosphate guanylyltransferase/mannose-6-phosphate isomerase
LSRSGFPKQFICLTGNESLLQLTAKRMAGLVHDDVDLNAPLVVTNEEHRFLALEQLNEISVEVSGLLLEPAARNTAPALTLAALAALEANGDPILVVTPADQTVSDSSAVQLAMQAAIRKAADGTIVILGVEPDRPEVGYDYINAAPGSDKLALAVLGFVEKPDEQKAQAYLDQGGYYWNARIFVLRASV